MKYRIADLIAEYEPKFDMLKERSKKYYISDKRKANIKINITNKEIQDIARDNCNNKKVLERIEYMEVGRTFYRELLNYNGCLLHSSAVVLNDGAYLFSGKSGIGKTTHTKLWLKYLEKENSYIINDDKPAIRIVDGKIYVYGTPFSGNDDINENKKVLLKAISFINQSESNSIRRLDSSEVLGSFFEQSMLFLNKKELSKFLEIFEFIYNNIPMYSFSCNISKEAFKLSYETMTGEKYKK